MRLAFYNLTATTKLGGVETCCWELARELCRRGHQAAIIGGEGPAREAPPPAGLTVETFSYTSRERFPAWGSRFRKLAERQSLARRALPRLAGGGFAAIVTVKPYDLPAALWARHRSGARVAYFSGGGEFFPGYAFLARRLDHFCACSAYDAADIAAHTGLRPAVNHYGVDVAAFAPGAPDPAQMRALGLDPAQPVVASAVRLVAFKGLDMGLRALALLRPRLPGLRYLLAGSGPEEAKLRALCGELGLEDTVRFLGPLPHHRLPAFYRLARVGLFPSVEKEALGIAVAEAMACGLPVVATRVGGMPEMVSEASGILVPPRDPAALAEALHALLTDPGQRERQGQAARLRVVEHFTWAACLDRLLAGLGLAEGA